MGADSTFKYAAATGNADAATLSISTATGGKNVVINSIETLTVNNTGTSAVGTVSSDTGKTVTVTGSGDLTANFALAANAVLETVSNTGTGKLTTDLTNAESIKSYTGGTGGDFVTIDGVHTNDVTINTGAGIDKVTLSGAGAETKTGLLPVLWTRS